jgi:hypothetical protein
MSGRQAGRDGQVDVMRPIAVVEMAGQVESHLAETLRDMAAQHRGEAAARWLLLADDATRGAQAAAKASGHLQQQARRWAEQADVAALRQALDHAATILADLARAENHIADILTTLASRNGSELTAERQQLATAASAAAGRARELSQALHRLAQTDGADAQLDGTPPAGLAAARIRLESCAPMRLADIERRLAELRRARRMAPGDSPVPSARPDALQRAREARQHWEESVAHLSEAQQLTVQAFGRAASAHDRAADASARSARAGMGDVAEHNRRAAFHRAAAQADRQQAQTIQDEAADPVENLGS